MNSWYEHALDLLLPRHCLLCGLGSGGFNICPPCARELPRDTGDCPACGPDTSGAEEEVCNPCRNGGPAWHSTVAATVYAFPVDQLVRSFKFSRNLAAGQVLAQELVHRVTRLGHALPDTIIPVPLHRSRLVGRGFNQSEWLARYVGKALGIAVCTRALRRKKRTRAQSGLDAAGRRINIRNCFECRYSPQDMQGLGEVALLDDVLTTGATLSECAELLRKHSVRRVSAWVAARAPATKVQPGE